MTKHIICQRCGSPEIRADAWASWNPELEMWELAEFFDMRFCQRCESETSCIEVDEETGLEIQAFAMKIEADGSSRAAEDGEMPDFYDVSVTTTPQARGRILSIEEIEELATRDDCENAIARLSRSYPRAAVTRHFE